MLSLGIVGVSFRGGNVDLLEAFTIPERGRVERLRQLKEACGFEELVALQTCNRAEFYFVGEAGASANDSRNRVLDFFLSQTAKLSFEPSDIYCHGSFRALRHLCRVAASLDSMMIGEPQILGQVKQALRDARAYDLSGAQLADVFTEAFRVARKIRRETPMGRCTVSMANLLHGVISEHLEGVSSANIAIIGVGPMSVKLARHLQEKTDTRLCFVNRTVAKAEALAAEHGGRAISLDDFLARPPAVDVVFTATGSEVPLIDRAAGRRLVAASSNGKTDILLIDFAIPRDIDAAVGDLAGVRCLAIPHFRTIAEQNRRERFQAVDAAERIIDEAIGRAHRNYVEQQFRPIMASTLSEGLAYAQAGLGRLFARKLSHLASDDRAVIEHWVNQLIRYTNQLPMTALAEQTDTAHGDCSSLAGYGCVRTRPETTINADHPGANRCSMEEGGPCREDEHVHAHHHPGAADA